MKHVARVLLLFAIFLSACDSSPLVPEGQEVPLSDVMAGAIIVHPNPSGIAPLTAELEFKTSEPVSVSWRVEGPDPMGREGLSTAEDHMLPLAGLYPGQENEVLLRFNLPNGDWAVDTFYVEMPELPEYFPEIEITTMLPSREPGWFQSDLSFGLGGRYGTTPMIYDNSGVVRWYLDLTDVGGMAFMLERLNNGNFITGFREDIFEYDVLGNVVNQWHTPGALYHHDVIEKPDGNLIVAVDFEAWDTIEDAAIELDRATGAVVNTWDLRPVLDMERRTLTGSDRDWFHMNSIWYDERDGGLIFSGRNQGVVKVSAANELVWILSPHDGWGTNQRGQNLDDFLLTAVDASGTPYPEAVQLGHERTPDFDWAWGQHAAMTLDSGNLLLFDNGFLRQFAQNDFYSRVVEYDIDETALTISQVWDYGRDRGRDQYSAIVSDVDVLPTTGNRLFAPGIMFQNPNFSWVTEVDMTGQVVHEAKVTFKNARGSGAFAWGEFDLVYRASKVDFRELLGM